MNFLGPVDSAFESQWRSSSPIAIPVSDQEMAYQALMALLKDAPEVRQEVQTAIQYRKAYQGKFLMGKPEKKLPVNVQVRPEFSDVIFAVNAAERLRALQGNLRIKLSPVGLPSSFDCGEAAFFQGLCPSGGYWEKALNGQIPQNSRTEIQRAAEITDMVVLNQHLKVKTTGVDGKFATTFLCSLIALPLEILAVLLQQYLLIAAPTVISEFPELKGKKTKGHGEDISYDNAVGIHTRYYAPHITSEFQHERSAIETKSHADENTIVVAHHAYFRNTPIPAQTINPAAVLRHEVGHAMNAIAGEEQDLPTIADKEEIRAAYTKDEAHWTQSQRQDLKNEGVEEVCADIQEHLLAAYASQTSDAANKRVIEACPNLAKLVKEEDEALFNIRFPKRVLSFLA